MTEDYSVEVCRKLEEEFRSLGLYRPMRVSRYEPGTEMVYDVTGAGDAAKGLVRLVIENFVGGGFAGQVYRVKITQISPQADSVAGLKVGGIYAMKILVPPSSGSRLFRNFLYRVGFQGPFQLQVNPAAARAGALWQKFIRRAAKIRFGNEKTVVDIYATFVDEKIGSCGELSEWIDGRTWRLEVDEHIDLMRRWYRGKSVNEQLLGSPEYRAKKKFMAEFVKLLHDIGAFELARQYEWSTCKSQPNCLKRTGTENDPSAGLTAVDFRAGLALLPVLPMSPGDFKLIAKGLARGSLVQFDRGDLGKLEQFVCAHKNEFADMQGMLEELKRAEQIYRDSIPDVTHNHVRLLYSGRLWSTMLDSAITGWKVKGLVDDNSQKKLRGSKLLTVLFFIIGLIPFIGKVFRRIWARPDWQRHYLAALTSRNYFIQAIRGRMLEKVIAWYRAGRVDDKRALSVAASFPRFVFHLPFCLLPAGLHRFVTDRQFRREKLAYIFVRPFKLYFNAQLREQWLSEMLVDGQAKHMLTDEDAAVIRSQIKEPFIQKYLVSLVVHLMTLPITQMVSVSLAIIYVLTHPEMPRAQVWGVAAGIIALFQVVPVSPGSLCRGLYVLYLVIRERNFKDYNIAVFLGFLKYVGYLAFPIQMTYRYPALARFMAGHWATEAVHIVPVFGERGALLEHWVFRLFYNWPLTIRRRMRRRAEIRATIKPRYWHADWYIPAATLVFGFADFIYLKAYGTLPELSNIWWLSVIVPLLVGAGVTMGCGGAVLWKRITAATISGLIIGILYGAVSAILSFPDIIPASGIVLTCVWRAFVFALLATIGAILTEVMLPDPDIKQGLKV
jgi:hypothetical protein